MKNIILNLIFGLIIFSISAQNTSVKILSQKTDSLLNGTTHIVYGDGATHDIKKEFNAVMNTQDSMLVAIKRQEIITIPGTFDYFCWYLCYPPVAANSKPTWNADDSLMMYNGDTISNFSVYFQPEMKMGQSKYRYVFYPGDNPSDSSYFDVIFDVVTVGVATSIEIPISAYPNPFSEYLIIDIPGTVNSGNLSFQLFDILGKMVLEGTLKNNENRISISSKIPSGTFFMKVYQGEKVIYNDVYIKK